MSSADVESLQPVPRQRSRCLDAFLLGSVLTLFVMVLSGTALGFWAIQGLRENIKLHGDLKPPTSSSLERLLGSPNKMQSFAYLAADTTEVESGIMRWKPVSYGKTNSTIGSHYRFISSQQALTMLKDGAYFLYIELNVTCPGVSCSSGSLTVTFDDGTTHGPLSCTLHLKTNEPSAKKCWTVIPHIQSETRMMARMHARVSPGWRLELNHSGFGMFLVDGPWTE